MLLLHKPVQAYPTNKDMLGLVYATEALLGLDDYCMEYIGAYREGLIGTTKKK